MCQLQVRVELLWMVPVCSFLRNGRIQVCRLNTGSSLLLGVEVGGWGVFLFECIDNCRYFS